MRPVFFTLEGFTSRYISGVRRVFGELLSRLPALGRTCILEPGFINGPIPRAVRDGVRHLPPRVVLPYFRGSARVAKAANWILQPLSRPPADAIFHPTFFRSLPARRTAGLVVTAHDVIAERLAPGSAELAVQRQMLRAADAVIAVSESTRRDLLELLQLPPERVVVVHNGVNLDGAAPVALPRLAGRPYLLWVGTRGGYKNFPRTTQALAGCAETKDLLVFCAGGGRLLPKERKQLVALGLTDRVWQADVTEGELRWAYEHAQALLYTSEYEGFGLPILEAFACGCPVLCSQTSSMPEVGGDVAAYADPTNVESIADGLRVVLRSGRSPEAAARRRARAALFNWDRCAEKTNAVYKSLD